MSLEQGQAIELRVTPDAYVTVRYAGASGDFNPIHIDEDFARQVGLPGRILHGLWTMAQVARAHTDAAGGPQKLKRLSVQFRGMGRIGEEIVVSGTVQEVRDGVAVLERLLAPAGLQVIAGKLNEINGGSIRLFISHVGRRQQTLEAADWLQELRVREFEMALDSPAPYDEFACNVERVRSELRELIESILDEGKTIHVYGASTKGNVILQYIGLNRDLIPYAADRNPDKWGSHTIRTGIPIISEEESRAMKPDYYLVLPWHFLDEFVEREREYRSSGCKFIVPLPEGRVVEG